MWVPWKLESCSAPVSLKLLWPGVVGVLHLKLGAGV